MNYLVTFFSSSSGDPAEPALDKPKRANQNFCLVNIEAFKLHPHNLYYYLLSLFYNKYRVNNFV